ncbi:MULTISPECIES: NF038104 family lipoprotein [unclassified Acinetobacter]|uniref:NF038104 family lipoprotein n=1 Tax=unclassified Acinetobacter TaxID=196816 RepID=UPI0029348B92|nr:MULTISPECIES: NF038104 family lipoprotein [unclassified Acinetobacter]WOE31631.1 NF038104 family lipoprotein [Acinetobacter sp. SAAs470]WOE37096.1 NF038104 family lipoprotein [Acinetobacter sp. SAAs474]
MNKVIIVLASMLLLQGCITKLVTVPVGLAYDVTKGAVKGTVAVVDAVIPDGDDDEDDQKHKKNND